MGHAAYRAGECWLRLRGDALLWTLLVAAALAITTADDPLLLCGPTALCPCEAFVPNSQTLRQWRPIALPARRDAPEGRQYGEIAVCRRLGLTSVPLVAALQVNATDTFGGLPTIPIYLSFSNNAITSISAVSFAGYPPNIYYLSFRYNALTQLHVHSLRPFPNLRFIDLDFNYGLARIPPRLFVPTPNLQSLAIYGLSLRVIETGIFDGLSASASEIILIPAVDFGRISPPIEVIIGGETVFRNLDHARLLDLSMQPILRAALPDWDKMAANLPTLKALHARYPVYLRSEYGGELEFPRFGRIPTLNRLVVIESRIPAFRRSDFDDGFNPGLGELVYSDLTCEMRVIERGAFAPLQQLHLVYNDDDWGCQGKASRCIGPSTQLNCTCHPDYTGDGTFCEPACPHRANYTLPGVSEPLAANCSLANRWEGSHCCTSAPGGRVEAASWPLTHDTCSGVTLLCQGGLWTPRSAACSAACGSCKPDSASPSGSFIDVKSTNCVLPVPVLPLFPADAITIVVNGLAMPVLPDAGFPAGTESITLRLTALTTVLPHYFANISALKYLNLAHNPQLTRLAPNTFAGLPTLQKLDIDNSALTMLRTGVFNGLSFLTTLSIRTTGLAGIDPGVFSPLAGLQVLDLSAFSGIHACTVRMHPKELRPLTSLSRLSIAGCNTLQKMWETEYDFAAEAPGIASQLQHLVMDLAPDSFLHRLFPNLRTLELPSGTATALTPSALENKLELTFLELEVFPNMHRIAKEALSAATLPKLSSLRMLLVQSACSLTGTASDGSPAFSCRCSSGYGGPDGVFCEAICEDPPLAGSICSDSVFYQGVHCAQPSGAGLAEVCDGGEWQAVGQFCHTGTCACDLDTGFVACAGGGLQQVPLWTLANSSSVVVLDLSNNPSLRQLRTNSLDGFSNLAALRLSRCGLAEISSDIFTRLSALEELRLDHNALTHIAPGAFLNNRALRVLDLAGNALMDMFPLNMLGALPALEFLDMSGIASVAESVAVFQSPPAGAFPALDTLRLAGTNLTAVPADLIVGGLRVLDLSSNPLEGVAAADLTGGRASLQELLLDNLTDARVLVEPGVFGTLPTLSRLSVSAENFACWMEGGEGRVVECRCSAEVGAPPTRLAADNSTCVLFCRASAEGCPPGEEGDSCQVDCGPRPALVAEGLEPLVDAEIYVCERGLWTLLGGSCELVFPRAPTAQPSAPPTTAPTILPTLLPTPAPTASNPSSSLSSSSSSSAALLGGVVAAVVLIALVVIALLAILRRRKGGKERHSRLAILGELRELVQQPNMQARETYVTKFGAVLGGLEESDRRLAEFERAVGVISVDSDSRLLGSGQYGRVLLGSMASRQDGGGMEPSSATPVAVKMLHEGEVNGAACVMLLLEARVMAMLQHRNLVQLVAVQTQYAPVMVALEFCPLGDLRSFLLRWREERRADADLRAQFPALMLQVASVVAYLHSKLLLHRDLAARNVLVLDERCGAASYTLKLSDLGLSRGVTDDSDYYRQMSSDRVPVKWMCPLAVSLKRFTKKSDVWSFGVLGWEMYSFGVAPFEKMHATEVVLGLQQGRRLKQPAHCPREVYELMLECWAKSEPERPSFANLCLRLEGMCGGRGSGHGRSEAWAEAATTERQAPVIGLTRRDANMVVTDNDQDEEETYI